MPIRARVRSDFRLVHEPIGKDDDWNLLPEEADVVRRLSDRLRHSSGGTFLITGFRGVGKTTVVRRAILEAAKGDDQGLVDVTVPLARPVTTTVLLFEVMRRLFECLRGTRLLRSLNPKLREELLTAYRRTSYAIRQTTTKGNTVETRVGWGGDLSLGKAKVPLPHISRRRNRAEAEATEISFLAYSDTDVEHDFLRVIELLGRPGGMKKQRLRKLLGKIAPRWAPPPFPRLVVVFDEIDKLTEGDDGLATFKGILSGLKNVLAASGVHFVLVGGVDLHDEWLRESATADSLYRSVFAWQGYIGCSWQAAPRLVQDALDGASEDATAVLAAYLQYRGRGVVRNILYELNELIEWDEDGPQIWIDGTAEDRVRLLAELSDALQQAFGGGEEDSVLATPSDLDRVKQVAYFTSDWVLRAGREKFTVADILDPARGTPLDSVLQPTQELIRKSLLALESGTYLEREVRDPDQETRGPAAERYPEQFQLSKELLSRLALIARSSPQARAEFGRPAGVTVDVDSAWDWGIGEPKQRAQEVAGERYVILRRVGQGGFGTVWEAVDRERDEIIAIKVVRTPSDEARQRVLREAALLREANGRGVVRLLDLIEAEGRIGIVTEFFDGIDLAEVGRFPPAEAVQTVMEVLHIVEGLHRDNIIHADLKPSNILMVGGERPILVDFGTAERLGEASPVANLQVDDDVTRIGISGTPAYMAPELFLGGTPTEASDVWAVGLLLLELMLGELPRDRTRDALIKAITSLPVSPPLRACLASALDPEPARRPSAATFHRELAETPEGQYRPGDGSDLMDVE